MTLKFKQGEVWLANLNPNKGKEPGKTRPVLLVQNQVLLDVEHPTTLIIPLSTKLVDGAYPLRVRLKAKQELKKDSDLLIDQLRAIDNSRLSKGPLLKLTSLQLANVHEAIAELIGLELF